VIKGSVSRDGYYFQFLQALKIKQVFSVCVLVVFKFFCCFLRKSHMKFRVASAKTLSNSKNQLSNSLQKACCDI
jgi:hypothetical protein